MKSDNVFGGFLRYITKYHSKCETHQYTIPDIDSEIVCFGPSVEKYTNYTGIYPIKNLKRNKKGYLIFKDLTDS